MFHSHSVQNINSNWSNLHNIFDQSQIFFFKNAKIKRINFQVSLIIFQWLEKNLQNYLIIFR